MDPDSARLEAQRLGVLKRDLFGAVELWRLGAGERVIVRRRLEPCEARGLGVPVLLRAPGRWIGGLLARREQKFLVRLERCLERDPDLARQLADRVPRPLSQGQTADLQQAWARSNRGQRQARARLSARAYLEGLPLQRATQLRRDYFEALEALLGGLHRLGLRHNDLHKEPNLLVRPDGSPALIDFQLASWHSRPGRSARVRAAEDLRHIRKHAQRYWTQAGRIKAAGPLPAPGQRSALAEGWRRYGKPIYRWLTRRLLRWRDGETPRPVQGPWPQWID